MLVWPLLKISLFALGLVLFLPMATGFAQVDPSAEALYLEARRFLVGIERRFDEAQATELFKQAAQKGDPRALAWQARRMFYGGQGFSKNPAEAKVLFLKIEKSLEAMAEKDLPDAKQSLAVSWGTLFPKEKGIQAFKLLEGITAKAPASQWDDLAWFYEEGIGVKKDPQKAFEYYLKSAEAGNAWGQYLVGDLYYSGRGVVQDHGKGFQWFRKSADRGNSKAFTMIGLSYETGNGVAKDEKEAVKWYTKAAEKGDGWALNQLGLCYENGRGVEKDPKRAFKYYLKSAEVGDDWGQRNAANCYYNGWGVERDYGQAFSWFQKSADQGNASGMGNVGFCYETGNGVAKDEKEAVKWYTKAAEKGDGWALNKLGFCYYIARGVSRDYGQAFSWFQKSADQGNTGGMGNLGLCYETGNGVTKDEKEAVRWYQKAADTGDGWALNRLGQCYEYGRGVEKDPKRAFESYLKSAEAGNEWGQNSVGNAYLNGQGVRQNDKQAYFWLQKAADQKNWMALANLGFCLQYGRGTKANPELALEKYRAAAEGKNNFAKKQIQSLAEACFWEKNYALSSRAFEISQTFGNSGAAEGLYRNHVLMRKFWPGADPRKGLTALWESLRDDPSKNAELLALAYEALDLGYPSLARKICSLALAGICPFPSVNPALHSSFHKVRGYALLADKDVGPRMVKDEIPAAWPSWLVPEFTGVGYLLGNLVAGSKPLESRLQFQTDFFAPGPPRWWGILGAEILAWGLQLRAGKESGWYPRLVRAAKTDSRSGIDFFWGTVARNNLESAEADFQKAEGEDLFSALAGRMVVASQKNDPAVLKELTAQLLAKLQEVQMEKSRSSRKVKKTGSGLSPSLTESLAQAKPGALPWGNELGEFSFGMGLSSAGPGAVIFSHGILEAAKSFFWPLLLRLKPEWALFSCDLLLKSKTFLPNEAISFYELLAKRPATRAQASIRLVHLHTENQNYSEAIEWAKTALEENPDPNTKAWLKAVVLWAESKVEQSKRDIPTPSFGNFPQKKTEPVSTNIPQARYLAIYVALQDVEKATPGKEEALSKYKKIREDLRALEKQYPDWEPTIIRYRLKYVQKKIEELQQPE